MRAPNENAPTFGRSRGAYQNLAGLQSHCNPYVEILLNRLEHVREYGKGWRARCPVHGGNSDGSLSIAEGDDGRILIHCFALCEPLEILKVCGLEMGDLFPKRITHATTPQERCELREAARQSRWKAAMPVLVFEALVVLTAARQIARKKPLNEKDDARLAEAIERIESARKVFDGR